MDTKWTILSGGRLSDDQLTGKASFTLSTDEAFESVLLKNESIKKAFEEKLRQELATIGITSSAKASLTMEYKSVALTYPSRERHVELTVVVKDSSTESILWYFVLVSPESSISNKSLYEIVDIISLRFPLKNKSESSDFK
jgi:hypothetical protein